jgi:hypothetical protein
VVVVILIMVGAGDGEAGKGRAVGKVGPEDGEERGHAVVEGRVGSAKDWLLLGSGFASSVVGFGNGGSVGAREGESVVGC